MSDGWKKSCLVCRARRRLGARPLRPDFNVIRRQLQTHRNLTLQLTGEEYREDHHDGYSYSRYVAAVFMLRDHLKTMTVPGTGNVLAT